MQACLERLWHPLMLLTELLLCAPLSVWWSAFARPFRKSLSSKPHGIPSILSKINIGQHGLNIRAHLCTETKYVCMQARLERLWHPLMLLTELLLCAPISIWWSVFARRFRKPLSPSVSAALQSSSQNEKSDDGVSADGLWALNAPLHQEEMPASSTLEQTCSDGQARVRGSTRSHPANQEGERAMCPFGFRFLLLVFISFLTNSAQNATTYLHESFFTSQNRQYIECAVDAWFHLLVQTRSLLIVARA
jgi:hypothetical protein